MLMEHKVDLIPAVILFAYDPELMKVSRMLFTQGESVGPTQTLLWAARASFLQKNCAAMVDFMEDVLRARRFYFDPKNHKEAVEIVSKFTKQPPEFFEGWMFTSKDNYRDPNALPNLQSMQANINKQKELGFLKNDIDVPKYADLSITKEAGERLKKLTRPSSAAPSQVAGSGRAGVRRRQDVVLQPADALDLDRDLVPCPEQPGLARVHVLEDLFDLVPTDLDPVRHSGAGTSCPPR